VVAILFGIGLKVPLTHGLTLDSARDCDDNAVIRCGALDFSEVTNRYQNTGVAPIYNHFGISSQDINDFSNVAVEGVVTNNNNVWIKRSSGLCPDIDQSTLSAHNRQAVQNNPNLCLVATDAMTAGRQNLSGSSAVSRNGTTFYVRPPSVSFASSSLPAFVVMKNGSFSYAIIASCGNPVMATPVTPTAAPKPKPAATLAPPAPSTPAAPTQAQTQTQTQSQAVTVTPAVVTTPAPQVQSATTSAPAAAKTIPNTGPGNIVSLFGISTILGTFGHWIYSRRLKLN
jgi:hypothetical protein